MFKVILVVHADLWVHIFMFLTNFETNSYFDDFKGLSITNPQCYQKTPIVFIFFASVYVSIAIMNCK